MNKYKGATISFLMKQLRHVVQAQQFDRELLEEIFKDVEFMQRVTELGRMNTLSGKVMACMFYEPSTRTRFSFEAAMVRLGGRVISTESAGVFSSVAKGESLKDTIRIVGNYVDIIVLRHKEEGSSKLASEVSSVPIVNAGDGMGQHPTQALLDLFTIKQKLGRLDNISVALVGDLKHGRTVHSLAYLLEKFDNVKLYFVSPDTCKMKPEILDWLRTKKVHFEETDALESIIPIVDCLYMTRVQKERFDNMDEYNSAKGKIVLSLDLVQKMKGSAIIMHPLPRLDEIPPEIDDNPRAVYFQQAKNGLFVRMALLKKLLT